jgi:hypothetical protein
MKPHEITAAHEAERKEKRATLIKGILDNVGGEILNSKNFGKRANEQMLKIDIKLSEAFIYNSFFAMDIGTMFFALIQAHITDELEREGL